MKNAAAYRKNLSQLLRGIGKARKQACESDDLVRTLMLAVLSGDSTVRQVEQVIDDLQQEFVDFNELRVASSKELAEHIGRGVFGAGEKAEMLREFLNNVFTRTSDIGVDWLKEIPKRELRQRLGGMGLGPYAAAYMCLYGFGTSGVPVDASLVECLQINECLAGDEKAADVQATLEKMIPIKQHSAAHEFFRAYIEKHSKALAKKRAADAKVRAEVEAKAKAEADAKAKAQAEAQAEADAKAKAAAEAKEAKAKASESNAASGKHGAVGKKAGGSKRPSGKGRRK